MEIALMVEAFDMVFEYDSGMLIDDLKIPATFDLQSFEEFFYLDRQPSGEFVIVLKEGGLFFFCRIISKTLRNFARGMICTSFRINRSINSLKSV